MFAFAIVEHGAVVWCWPGPARDQAALPGPDPARLRFASTLPALLAGGGTDTSIDRTALSYYMTFHSVVPAPRTILNGVRKLPPATIRVVEPDGKTRDRVYWEPAFNRDPERADWTERDWQDELLARCARLSTAAWSPTCRSAYCSRGASTPAWSSRCWPRPARPGLRTFSIGFDSAGGESGDEFEYSTLVAERFGTEHHRIPIETSRLLPGIDGAVRAMSEPMVSHDCVAFYLLSQEVSQSGEGRPVRPGRRRGAGRL